jgi:outer membrane protein OmpA-like peptidoglycan-associated protein
MKNHLFSFLTHTAILGVLSVCLDVIAQTESAATLNDPSSLQQTEANRSRDEVRETDPLERNITLPKVDTSPATRIAPVVGILPKKNTFQGTVSFSANGAELSPQAEAVLDSIVAQVQKDQPVALTLALQTTASVSDPGAASHQNEELEQQVNPQSSKAATPQDSAAGFPVESGVVTHTNDTTQRANESGLASAQQVHYVAEQRVTAIERYLKSQGIQVHSVNIEGAGNHDQRESLSPTKASEEAPQQIRLVVLGEMASERVGGLIDD